MMGPRAATGTWPYRHRTIAMVDAARRCGVPITAAGRKADRPPAALRAEEASAADAARPQGPEK